MKIILTFLSSFFIVLTKSAFVPDAINTFDERTSRFITIFRDETVEIIDMEKPLPDDFTVSDSEISLHLFTRNNPTQAQDFPLDVQAVISSQFFDKEKLNIFSVHGWTNDQYHEMNQKIRDASLQTEDANIFVVDWSGPASELYVSASGKVKQIGDALGKFILELQETSGIGPENFKLIGYSLGCHVVANAGRAANGNVATIVALDPAGPLFYLTHEDKRLRNTDGQFVHVIHTNAGKLGYVGDLGDADYKANGGSRQPDCGIDITGNCSHRRAFQYYAESIASGGFTSWQCDSEKNFKNKNCENNTISRLGGKRVDRNASGRYYLNTNSEPPYSIS